MRLGTRVLLVENDRSTSEFVETEPSHQRLEVRCACDGISGLEGVEPPTARW